MARAQFCAILGIGLMLAASSSQARELVLGVNSRIGGDSNVFRATTDKTGDGFWSIAPRLTVRTAKEKLNYNVWYEPTYTTYFETSDIDGFDHRGQGLLSWRPTPRDTLDMNVIHRNVRILGLDDVTVPTDPEAVLVGTDGERYRLTNARVSYERALNARWSIVGAGFFDDYDYSRDTSIDSQGYGVELRTQFVWSPRALVGLAGSYRRRDSDSGGGFQPAQLVDVWNVAAFIQYAIRPSISLLLQAGPSFIESEQDFDDLATPVPIPNDKDRRTSYFATARIEKSWRFSMVRAGYTRSESAGGGSSYASILDQVRLEGEYRFDRDWRARVAGTWVQRQEIASVAGRNRDDTTQYLFYFTLIRRLAKRLEAIGQYSMIYQDDNDSNNVQSLGAIHRGYIGLRYTFDPIVF
jgi:hypothetical protein